MEHAHKYGLDHAERPSIDYGENDNIWKKTAETTRHKPYIELSDLCQKLAMRDGQIFAYFLDGSRRVFKVDDIAYSQSGGRSVIYPVIAGQIGVGCCCRVNKRIIPVKFKREIVLSIPDIANADGKSGFFPATAKKLNDSDELKRLGVEFSTILPYKTAKNIDKKFEDRATACVQDRMIEREKELVAELVREGKLSQDSYLETAEISAIFEFDETAHPLYNKYFKRLRRVRYIDFNQGVDARLVTDAKMKKLAEINIRPLRIAFDHYAQHKTYEKAIRLAAKYGIKDLSNYLLYNFNDKPDDLYNRMRINIDLCEEKELDVTIYSFPMKYQPIDDSEFYWNRDYIGKHWNRKFIRAIQAVLNSTKGKIGRGKSFFEEAFGRDIDGFHKILWMPEAFIIHRFKYKDNLTAEWWEKFCCLNETQSKKLKKIVAKNKFDDSTKTGDPFVDEVLAYYRVQRDSH